jgi:hypothetical protein
VALAVRAPVLVLPLVALLPDQPPEAVQAVALVEDQAKVELPPLATLVGLAVSETVGVGAVTETVADCDAEPPVPLQVNVNVVAVVSAGVVWVPLVPSAPLQPPDAVQAVALVETQIRVDVPPLATVLGLAVSVTAGAGVVTVTVADCAALPPLPLQVSI